MPYLDVLTILAQASFKEDASREAVDIRSIRAKNLPSACEVSSMDILLRWDCRNVLARREEPLTWRTERRATAECPLWEFAVKPNDWRCEGEAGSEKTSRSFPAAFSFMIANFSGVISADV